MADSQSGYPSRELGIDPIIGKKGSNQILRGNPRPNQSTLGPGGNRVQAGQLPKTSGPTIGASTKANPLGSHGSSSMED